LRRANAALEEKIVEHKRLEAEREKLEFRNRQLQKAESLGRMAGAIAHHFNNQLAVVIGNLELVMEEPAMAAPLENLAASLTAARRAAEVSGLMLTYLGQTTVQRVPMDLSDVCCRSLPLLRAAMPQGIPLETDFSTSGPVVSGDPKLLQQVLTHLITNAGESIAGGRGNVQLTLRTVSPGNIPESNRRPLGWQPVASAYACLEVRDSGCGIAEEDIEKLFDPFYTSKFPGRGLGLPVVLGIVRAHNGVITVESEPGQGSIFRVYLPLSAETVSRPPEKIATSALMEGANTVLLIEDEAPVRKMAGTMLSRLGYTVLAASNGDEAVELFHRHGDEIRWVLCDLTMPGMDGWTTLSALRFLSPDLPVILTSGYDEGQVMAADHPDRPNAFLHKPFTRKDLADTIRRILGRFPEGTAPQENRPEGMTKGPHGK
jgi:two-component system, cell cycle sensor histidine kinase and response regulator CckA